MTENKDPEEIFDQSKDQDRHTAEAPSEAEDAEPERSLEDEIVDVYQDLDAGEVPSNLTMRDENLAALIRGLEAAGELDDLGAAARDELGRDAVDEESRGSVLSLLVRVGLSEIEPGHLDTAKRALQRHLEQQSSEF